MGKASSAQDGNQIEKYIPSKIEKKWQDNWEANRVYSVSLDQIKNPFYVLVEFTYPSGDLHMGHWFAFSIPDMYARMKRMQGFDVFFPNGFDAFGLPAENAAIKRNIHPKDWTLSNIQRMKGQFRLMGASYNWDNEVITCLPEYYRWNQWIFLKMAEKGIAYRAKTLSNWCPNDQTVLANEHVEDGKCWRCGAVVIQKEVEQWFLKITAYADRLLWPSEASAKEGKSENVDWPKSVKEGQNSWIGKSEGALIEFKVDNLDRQINLKSAELKVFTTRPDTLWGATFVVLAPEHPIVDSLLKGKGKIEKGKVKKNETANDIESMDLDIDNREDIISSVKKYVEVSSKKTELERKENKEKTGVFTGLYCTNPASGEKIPVWVADYVLSGYGTGAIMAVPAHDERDFEFAKKYKLPIKQVIVPDDEFAEFDKNVDKSGELKQPYLGEGGIVNSGDDWNDYHVPAALPKIIDDVEKKGIGKRQVQYHLHDWSVSRQRYWGTPVPMINCGNCGIVPVPEKDLPVELPYDVDYQPKGRAPLATNEEWMRVKCPKCEGDATRDPETLDTFFDSSWYMFRYLSPHFDGGLFDQNIEKKVMPVNIYFGGAEHTLGHTLYSRFFTKFFKDTGLTDLEEYAKRRIQHGIILGPDGQKMSKSHGNVINPDDQVKQYGADAVRIYLAFLGPYDLVAPWNAGGIEGIHRFLKRVWGLYDKIQDPLSKKQELTQDDLHEMHRTIKKVTDDIEGVKLNTAIASLMEWLNHLSRKELVSIEEYQTFLKLLAPFAPHMTEELWERELKESSVSEVSGGGSIHIQKWPILDEKYLQQSELTIAIQVNGKRRGEIRIQNSESIVQNLVEEKSKEVIRTHLEGQEIRKVIYVPGKIINFVI